MAENDGRNYTTNLEMVLPKQSEQYNIDDFNNNFQKIDDFAGQTPPKALTADELTVARKINGVDFKGNQDITIPTVNLTGNQTIEGIKTFSETIQGNIASAVIATKANQDANGDVIDTTYTKNTDEKFHALKSYSDNGELLTDSEGLADVKSYAHSTFDKSKFTVVGTPTITDDGIASGFSSSNYVTAPTMTLGNNFKLHLPFTLPNTISATQIYRMQKDSAFRFLLTIGNGLNVYFNFLDDNGVNSDLLYILDGDEGVAGDSYIAVIELKNGTLTYGYIHNGVYTQKGTTTSELNFTTVINRFFIGRGGTEGYNGSIDLKQFSITVDGVPVFLGNKTGIDTIKPDDYTVVGTPTISADGIVSGFASGNYLTKSLSLGFSTNGETVIEAKGVFKGNTTQRLFADLANSVKTRIYYDTTTLKWYFAYYGSVNSTNVNVAITMNNGDKFYLKAIAKATGLYLYIENYTTNLSNSNSQSATITPAPSNIDYTFSSTVDVWAGSIDLNAFKIYVDGNLVYQPCLKIPYTLSKTGSKIVNSVYRDRVSDMYEQFGYAPYYTLSDTDFTLPMGEVYGMIEGKADKDLTNCTTGAFESVIALAQTGGKETVMNWGMPDYSAGISVSTGNYTPDTDGYLIGWLHADGNNEFSISYNNTQIFYFKNSSSWESSKGWCIPLSKSETYALSGSGIDSLKFYPLKGAN